MSTSETPQDQPEEDSILSSLTTLGLKLVKACQYAHLEQGVTVKDLIWMLHGIMGQVLSWGYRR
jgi:hypothetical protein